MTKLIKYLVISDIHLGHRKNPTEDIIENLGIFFNQYQKRSDLDFIFIAGDLTDRLLDLSQSASAMILLWCMDLLGFCQRSNIKLRILAGTPSHDWSQPKFFTSLTKAYDKLDAKYVSDLSIEIDTKTGLSILYVPDEWRHSTDKTLEEVHDLLKAKNLEKVDIAIMHGMFKYQSPVPGAKLPLHDEDSYLRIVKHYINIGHIHNFSTYSRIIAQGSFDRLAHGEENPKGAVEVNLFPDGSREFYFIENKHAKVFKTITLKSKDGEKATREIEKHLKGIKPLSHIRIKCSKEHPIYIGFDEIRKQFTQFYLEKKSLEDKDNDNNDLVTPVAFSVDVFTPITITKDNIAKLLLDEIQSRTKLSAEQLLIFESAIK